MLSFQQDLQFALRQFLKNRTFSLVAVTTLALGIGGTTAIFSVLYGVLLRPPPFRDPGRLVLVSERAERFPILSASWQNFRDWRAQSHSFEEFGAVRNLTMSLTGRNEPEQIPAEMVTGNLFHLLGVSVPLGRAISVSDDLPSSAPVALISHDLWQRKFDGSASAIGHAVTLNSRSYTIIGVLPSGYEMLQQRPDVVVAMGPWASTLPDDRSWHPGIYPVARLRNGVTLAQARSEMSTIAKRLLEQYRDSNIALDAVVNPMQEQLVSDIRPVLLTLFGAVTFVLLIACSNVASLLLTRATTRQREMSIRAALGAPASRIVRQLITEGLLLSLMGAVAGVAIAYGAIAIFGHTAAAAGTGVADIHIDLHVLLFTAAVSVLAGVFFGFAPAAHLGLRDLRSVLSETDRGSVGGRAKRLRSTLVVGEIAIATVLVFGAGLFARSFARLSTVKPGFSVENILVADVPVSPGLYSNATDRMNFFDSAIEGLRAMPGVQAAGAASFLPVSGAGAILHFNIKGRPPQSPSEYVMANYRVVSAGYDRALKLRIIEGRWIEDADREGAPAVVVINQAMVHTFFHDKSPLGQYLQIGATPEPDVPWMRIVGVVGDTRQSLAADPATEMYVPFRQANQVLPVYNLSMVVRAHGDPMVLSNALRAVIHHLNPNQPVIRVRTMEENLAASIAQPRLRTLLLAIFAAVALLIAAVGIYGVMSYAIAQRSREMGIRLALGSSARGIFQLVVGEAMRLAGTGIVLGAVAALMAGAYVKSLLFGVPASDLLSLVASSAVVVCAALAASLGPARRAARLTISETLREN